MKKQAFILLSILFLIYPIFGFSNELTVEEIVTKANKASLYQGDDIKGKISIKITDSLGRERKRLINMMRKNIDNSDSQKYFVLFLRPADVKKMVFMVHKHGKVNLGDDRWLYMPGLDLVKRIAASDKRTSFAGSDFLYEDISGRNIKEDNHSLIETTKDFYILKSVPKENGRVEFSYYKSYIDKKTFLPLKIEYFKKAAKPYRIIKALKIENIKSLKNNKEIIYPTITLSMAKDLENKSSSEMKLNKIKYNTGIKDDLFSERYLRRPPSMLLR